MPLTVTITITTTITVTITSVLHAAMLRGGAIQPRPFVAVEDKQPIMADLSAITGLLAELEEARRGVLSSGREETLFDQHTCAGCLRQIKSVSSRLVSHLPDCQRSSELFQALLLKRALLLCFELLCYSRGTSRCELRELFGAVQTFNSRVNITWQRETCEEEIAGWGRDQLGVAVSFADLADTLVLCRGGVVSGRVEREGVASVGQWWVWSNEERERVREVLSMLAAQTSLLATGGRCVSMNAVVRVMEGRVWKEVGKRVESDPVKQALMDLIVTDGRYPAVDSVCVCAHVSLPLRRKTWLHSSCCPQVCVVSWDKQGGAATLQPDVQG